MLRRSRSSWSFSSAQTGPAVLFAAILLAAFIVSGSIAPAGAGPGIGQFELKTLESEHGYLEFQSQNAWSFGEPRRATAVVDGEPVYDDNTVIKQRHALEMEMGFTSFLKMRVGIEYEKERLDEPGTFAQADDFNPLKLEEVGAEVIAVFIPRNGDGFSMGAVTEVERSLERGEQMGLNLGPIFEYTAGPWFFAAIPMAVHHFGGDPGEDGLTDSKWDFAYAAQAAYTISPTWTVALEAYGTVDRILGSGTRTLADTMFGEHDQHRLGPVLYYAIDLGRSLRSDRPAGGDGDGESENSTVEIGIGYLAGLNGNTPDSTLKLSVEVEF